MKTSTTTKVILKSLDLELKAILKKDLEAFKAKQQSNNQSGAQQAA